MDGEGAFNRSPGGKSLPRRASQLRAKSSHSIFRSAVVSSGRLLDIDQDRQSHRGTWAEVPGIFRACCGVLAVGPSELSA
jgi:hypothetical protein